jgi:pimeloyl-ACP methyl ester carboxylesterase
MRSRIGQLVAGAAGIAGTVVATVATATPAEAATQYRVIGSLPQGIVESLADPSAPPAGVNVPGCHPSAAHPDPVVLVTGTFGNMIDDWGGLGPTLANQGYCVYSRAFGADPHGIIQTIGPVVTSAQQLAALVDSVRAQTGAARVDLVGHSQGGLIAEYYTKFLGGAGQVGALVGLSPTTHGTTLDGLATLAGFFPGANAIVRGVCPACADQEAGSDVVTALADGPIAQPGVRYTIIETRDEFVVTPAGSAFIGEPGVHNVWVQDSCPFDPVDHADLSYDKGVYGLVANALDPAHPSAVSCY